MAVGDIIQISLASGTNSFQPAAGVEIIVLKNLMDSVVGRYGFTDGAVNTTVYHSVGTSTYDQAGLGTKTAFTNAQYYYNDAAASNHGCCAIQIK